MHQLYILSELRKNRAVRSRVKVQCTAQPIPVKLTRRNCRRDTARIKVPPEPLDSSIMDTTSSDYTASRTSLKDTLA